MFEKKTLKRILSFVLTASLLAGGGSTAAFAASGQIPLGTSGEIIDFESLKDSVANQSVPLGTPLEDLNLPNSLRVIMEMSEQATPTGDTVSSIQDSGDLAQEDKTNPAATDFDGAAAEEPAASVNVDGPAEENAEVTLESGIDTDDTDSSQMPVSVSVEEWVSEPAFDAETMGNYVFTPVLDETWSFADGAELPTVTVQVDIGIMPLASDPAGDGWKDVENRDTTWTDGAISTPQELAQFAYLVNNASYSGEGDVWLLADIDLSGKEWTPIGNEDDDDKAYEGVFNGNGFSVKNMFCTSFTGINRQVDLYGLFGLLEGTVENVTVTGEIKCTVDYDYYCFIGGIAGYSARANIINCTSNVNITIESDVLSASSVGGVVGANYGEISYCTNMGNIYMKKGNSSPIGGITGINAGMIDRCQNQGDLTGYTTYIGGISGNNYIENGYYDDASVTNCYNLGTIADISGRVTLYYGGIAGEISNGFLVENCYSIAIPVDNVSWGNLAGKLNNIGIINNCYFLDNGSFGVCKVGNTFIDDFADDKGTKLADVQMKQDGFITQLNGNGNAFVFNENGYPLLADMPMTVCFVVTPADATINVSKDGAIIAAEADGTFLLIPGEYSVTANANNHAAKTQTITVSANKATHTVSISLDILPADYTKVDEALDNIPADLSIYTDESVAVLTSAKNAVELGKDITEQADVDGYAKAIEEAITALVKKSADYTKVNEALAKIPTDLSIYTDESVAVLTSAKNAVELGKNITEQADVDGYAKAIEEAITALVKKPATPTDPPTPTNPKPPNTGDNSSVVLWSLLTICSAVVIIISIKRKRAI